MGRVGVGEGGRRVGGGGGGVVGRSTGVSVFTLPNSSISQLGFQIYICITTF